MKDKLVIRFKAPFLNKPVKKLMDLLNESIHKYPFKEIIVEIDQKGGNFQAAKTLNRFLKSFPVPVTTYLAGPTDNIGLIVLGGGHTHLVSAEGSVKLQDLKACFFAKTYWTEKQMLEKLEGLRKERESFEMLLAGYFEISLEMIHQDIVEQKIYDVESLEKMGIAQVVQESPYSKLDSEIINLEIKTKQLEEAKEKTNKRVLN